MCLVLFALRECKLQYWCFSSLLSFRWALDVVVITVFTLISTDAPLRFYHKLRASCHYLGIKTPGEHFKRWKICRSAKLLIGAHACDLSTHTHLRCFLLRVLANRFKWKVLEHEDGRQVCETSLMGDWLDAVSSWLRCPAKSPSAGPPQLQSAPCLRPVNTSYPQLSRSLQLLLAINTAYDGKGLFKQDE